MKTTVLISANAEWRSIKSLFPQVAMVTSALGEWFSTRIEGQPVVFFHGGWGKISAAATAQYVLDRFQPDLLVNLGTCGGFEGRIEVGAVVLVERTIVYDIIEQMTDPDEAIEHYSTSLELAWLPAQLPALVRRGLLVSADRDILVQDIPMLVSRFGASAADWESGAIAWVAAKNHARCLILRGVTDIVGADGGEAYGNFSLFQNRTDEIMQRLVSELGGWLRVAEKAG
ncbi:MAG TPA: 5'-methylthioadenosine/S-adenosylhomocysteine nucleosidase [Anaerolineales bacterium]|jgi:adenosylhomocysteine nucleosidase